MINIEIDEPRSAQYHLKHFADIRTGGMSAAVAPGAYGKAWRRASRVISENCICASYQHRQRRPPWQSHPIIIREITMASAIPEIISSTGAIASPRQSPHRYRRLSIVCGEKHRGEQ